MAAACVALACGSSSKDTTTDTSGAATTTTSTPEPTSDGSGVGCEGYAPAEVKVSPEHGALIKGDVELAEYAGARCILGGGLFISEVSSLAPLEGLERLEGGLTIAGCPSLGTLDPLASLVHVGSSLYITRNPTLPELSGLSSLVFVGGDLQIGEPGTPQESGPSTLRGNDLLTDLEGLNALQSAGGIVIGDNDRLSSLAGIDHLPAASTALVNIVNNPLLPTAAAKTFATTVDDDGEMLLVCGNLDGEPCNWLIGD
ncbi:hypothetical protein [Nannocystis sp. SCPEA4]|uniref:hypothetical protein n=1 Tax=Nannocystis sp. SCPEA4 TaxID=2996787 RepID=UPI00226E1104|nr:hypothetical protein [Nannocystis sp. SCPEA4]MCY1062822.1 hypothetical protein [Nannocystis sp. SCPEA4]